MPVNAKKVRRLGRPRGKTQTINLHLKVSVEFVRSIDDWRRHQPDLPNRTEAIRRLVGRATRAGTTNVVGDGVVAQRGRKSPSGSRVRTADTPGEPRV
jgi:hypothetical protein